MVNTFILENNNNNKKDYLQHCVPLKLTAEMEVTAHAQLGALTPKGDAVCYCHTKRKSMHTAFMKEMEATPLMLF